MLAQKLAFPAVSREILLLALSAGAWPMASELAILLHGELDAALVRRLCLPGGTAVGAVVRGMVLVNESVVERMRLAPDVVEGLAARAHAELDFEEAALRGGASPLPAAGRRAVLVDDGSGDPSDWIAAARALRRQNAARVILAVPTINQEERALAASAIDEIATADRAPGPGLFCHPEERSDEGSAQGIVGKRQRISLA